MSKLVILLPPDRAASKAAEASEIASSWDGPVQILHLEAKDLYRQLDGAAAVLAYQHPGLHGWAKRVRALGAVPVACVDSSLQARLEALRFQGSSLVQVVQRSAREVRAEIRTLRDVGYAAAVQCNGAPTYDTYSHVNPNTILYFSTSIRESDYVSDAQMHQRLARYFGEQPLHLAFSGDWIRMRGVHHLTDMAQELKCCKVPYRLSIFGAGNLDVYLQGEILRLGLGNEVQLLGLGVDPHSFMKERVDVFIAPHLQQEDSSVYLNTLACGVPIIGYANQEWLGVLKYAQAGWSAQPGSPKALARMIASMPRQELANKALNALKFARRHSFERSVEARVNHIKSCV